MGVLAVGVVVGTGAMWVDYNNRVDETAADAADHAGPLPSSPTSTSASPTADAKVVSLWIGDGYTAGSGADKPETGESCVAAEELGWTCELAAERGTGFLSSGHAFDSSYDALVDRIDELPASEPDVVVVDAGRNDQGVYSQASIVEAMDTYLAKLRKTYPDAVLVQVVPWRLSQEGADQEMTAAVINLMDKYDGYVVDPVAQGWAGAGKTDQPDLLVADGIANQAGHELIGRKLAASIRALDLPVETEGTATTSASPSPGKSDEPSNSPSSSAS